MAKNSIMKGETARKRVKRYSTAVGAAAIVLTCVNEWQRELAKIDRLRVTSVQRSLFRWRPKFRTPFTLTTTIPAAPLEIFDAWLDVPGTPR